MESERRMIPLSLLAIPLAVGVYLMQTIPLIGIFMMMLGAIAWPAFLSWIAIVGTTLEAIQGRVSRRWLILPTLVLGCYEAYALADHARGWKVQRSVAESGSDPVGSVSVAGRSLVVRSSKDLVSGLVEHYRTDAVFQEIVEDGRPTRYVSYRLIPSNRCKDIRAAGGDRFVETIGFHVDALGSSHLDPGACKLIMGDLPGAVQVTVREEVAMDDAGGRPFVTERVLHVSAPGGRRIILRSRISRPLSWMPFFLAGCGLNSANPSWDCIVSPLRDTIGDPYGMEMEGRLARVLDLRARTPGEVPQADPDTLIADAARRLEAANDRRNEQAATLIDGILSDPSIHVPVGAIETLVDSPRVIGPRLRRMEALIEDAQAMAPPRQTVPVNCTPASIEAPCRFQNVSRNASSIHALLQWRIEPASLDDPYRRDLAGIRRRMSREAERMRQEAYDRRMERISKQNA